MQILLFLFLWLLIWSSAGALLSAWPMMQYVNYATHVKPPFWHVVRASFLAILLGYIAMSAICSPISGIVGFDVFDIPAVMFSLWFILHTILFKLLLKIPGDKPISFKHSLFASLITVLISLSCFVATLIFSVIRFG